MIRLTSRKRLLEILQDKLSNSETSVSVRLVQTQAKSPVLSARVGVAWHGLPVMRVRGARRSEHAQSISKWRTTMSLATKCAEKVEKFKREGTPN